jgi:hypothetical protein
VKFAWLCSILTGDLSRASIAILWSLLFILLSYNLVWLTAKITLFHICCHADKYFLCLLGCDAGGDEIVNDCFESLGGG